METPAVPPDPANPRNTAGCTPCHGSAQGKFNINTLAKHCRDKVNMSGLKSLEQKSWENMEDDYENDQSAVLHYLQMVECERRMEGRAVHHSNQGGTHGSAKGGMSKDNRQMKLTDSGKGGGTMRPAAQAVGVSNRTTATDRATGREGGPGHSGGNHGSTSQDNDLRQPIELQKQDMVVAWPPAVLIRGIEVDNASRNRLITIFSSCN